LRWCRRKSNILCYYSRKFSFLRHWKKLQKLWHPFPIMCINKILKLNICHELKLNRMFVVSVHSARQHKSVNIWKSYHMTPQIHADSMSIVLNAQKYVSCYICRYVHQLSSCRVQFNEEVRCYYVRVCDNYVNIMLLTIHCPRCLIYTAFWKLVLLLSLGEWMSWY
jgi:hypothetical protein